MYRLAAPGNRVLLWKCNIVYRRYIMSPALSTLLSGWVRMVAERIGPTPCSRCSDHCVGTGAQTQWLLIRWPWTIKCLLFCNKLFLQAFLLLKYKPEKRKLFNTFSYFSLSVKGPRLNRQHAGATKCSSSTTAICACWMDKTTGDLRFCKHDIIRIVKDE